MEKQIKQFEAKKFGATTIIDSFSNCKVSYVDYIDSICSEKDKSKFDQILKNSRITVFITLADEESAQWVINNYPVYYSCKVPTGYAANGSWQYHILIKNNISWDVGYVLNHLRDIDAEIAVGKGVIDPMFKPTKTIKNKFKEWLSRIIQKIS